MYVDHEMGAVVVSEGTGVGASAVSDALRQDPEVASLMRWHRRVTGADQRGRRGSIIERDRYLTPENVFAQMRMAQDALENDDVVSGFAEATEGLAFGRMAIECDDEDEMNVWEQIHEDLDLDSRMREIWRELLGVSQTNVCVWWGTKSYKVRGKTKGGNAKRKSFDNLRVPIGMSVLDPLKVVPLGSFLFGQEYLAYAADWAEQDIIDSYLLSRDNGFPMPPDQVIQTLIMDKVEPSLVDRRDMANLGIDVNRLYRLNPNNVFRHCATRSQYQRFSPVRMKSIFPILDLKDQLRQMDRAHLLGGINFIIICTKGSDTLPAQQAEIDNLKTQMRTLAQLPVLVGDHRLNVKIVTPAQDFTLDAARYLGLDARISARLYGMFITGSPTRGDDSVKLTKVVARGLENRRDAQRRTFMREVLLKTYNINDQLTERPSLKFYPRRIALDFDPALASYLLDLRDRGDLSRDSILSEIDYNQAEEARKRELEATNYDDIFQTSVPYTAGPGQVTPPGQPGPTDPKAGGRRMGGNKGGGGSAPGSGQGQSPRKPTAKPVAASRIKAEAAKRAGRTSRSSAPDPEAAAANQKLTAELTRKEQALEAKERELAAAVDRGDALEAALKAGREERMKPAPKVSRPYRSKKKAT